MAAASFWTSDSSVTSRAPTGVAESKYVPQPAQHSPNAYPPPTNVAISLSVGAGVLGTVTEAVSFEAVA
eukprot:2719983-Rhodomonas_salina.1